MDPTAGLSRIEDHRITQLAELFKRPTNQQRVERWRIERDIALSMAMEYQNAINLHVEPPKLLPELPAAAGLGRGKHLNGKMPLIEYGMGKGGLSFAAALKRAKSMGGSSGDEEEDEEEDDEEEPTPPPPPPQTLAIPPQKRIRRAPKQKTPEEIELAKTRVERQHAQYIRGLVDLYNDPTTSIVTLTKEVYESTLVRMKANLKAIENATVNVPKLRRMKTSTFTAKALRMRMPVGRVADMKPAKTDVERICPACNRLLDVFMVHNLACTGIKFHPECAAVLIDGVGAETFYDCLACMNHYLPNSNKLADRYQGCRHVTWKTAEVLAERGTAIKIFASPVA